MIFPSRNTLKLDKSNLKIFLNENGFIHFRKKIYQNLQSGEQCEVFDSVNPEKVLLKFIKSYQINI
ncbi:hypothetical protein YerA41_092 [Yersinia phage YerA41]|uniref:Uncharacterized protein n=1 Tax=Yersinia phage vB_Yru_GN1 TaxID=3074381 RepID=A0AA86M7Q9_9CAUD|nr:hypothetical protein YerA41_092 [Yersinia phage YerA41]BES79902.1 hypothetical protein [Yersinia phage vB_Yru_GN1]